MSLAPGLGLAPGAWAWRVAAVLRAERGSEERRTAREKREAECDEVAAPPWSARPSFADGRWGCAGLPTHVPAAAVLLHVFAEVGAPVAARGVLGSDGGYSPRRIEEGLPAEGRERLEGDGGLLQLGQERRMSEVRGAQGQRTCALLMSR